MSSGSAVYEVVHDRIGIIPIRVRQQERPLTRTTQLLQHRDHAGVMCDVFTGVRSDGAFHESVAVAEVHGTPDVTVDLLVGLRYFE